MRLSGGMRVGRSIFLSVDQMGFSIIQKLDQKKGCCGSPFSLGLHGFHGCSGLSRAESDILSKLFCFPCTHDGFKVANHAQAPLSFALLIEGTMFEKRDDQDTICAVSTAPGTGGIAVVRVSGAQAFVIGRKVCQFLPSEPDSHRIYYGILKSFLDNAPVDEVLVACFAQGRSFTGEQTIEVSCHGGQVITSLVLGELVSAGARLARPGEFSYRAYLNGRLDLIQAESVLALIESQSKQSAKVALRQLQGSLSQDFKRIEDDLVWLLAQLEASIDFSAEDIEIIPSQVLFGRTDRLMAFVAQLASSYHSGKIIKDGLQVALVGAPNAGKSSLLNAFLREDRAIVTPYAGTTRDLVEGKLSIGGLLVTLIDTAGIRDTQDEIEKIGIARSRSAMIAADIIFQLFDISDPTWEALLTKALGELPADSAGVAGSRYFLFNKTDLLSTPGELDFIQRKPVVTSLGERAFWLSAAQGTGLGKLEELLLSQTAHLVADDQSVVTQARHLDGLLRIQKGLKRALSLISEDSSPEFIAFELQEAVMVIHGLLGQEFDEQVIDRIFKEFCLGK